VNRIIDLGILPEDKICKQLDRVLPCDWSAMTPSRWHDCGVDLAPEEIKVQRQRYDKELKDMLHIGLNNEQIAELHERGEDELLPWQLITAIRMQPYKDALDTLLEGIVAQVKRHQPFEQLEKDCQDIINGFRNTVTRLRETEVKAGLVFDPAMFIYFIEKYRDNHKRLGGWYSIASDLFCIVGCGTYQFVNTRCGRRLDQAGIYKVIEGREIPPDVVRPVDDHLGRSYFLSLYDGGRRARAGAAWRAAGEVGVGVGCLAKLYVNQKRLHCADACLRRGHASRRQSRRIGA
jgi:hypothetical protein